MSWLDGIWNYWWSGVLSWLQGALDIVFSNLGFFLTQPGSFSGTPAYHIWLTVWGIVLAALGLAVAGVGLYYLTTNLVERKARLRELWTKLMAALVLSASSVPIADMSIQLANALTNAIAPSSSLTFQGSSLTALGPLSTVVGFIGLFLLFALLIEMGVRVLMIFFAGAILPIGYFLWIFPVTASYGTKIIKMFFEWTFLNMFMAVTLLLTVTVINQANGWSDFEAAFILLAGLSLTAAMPKVMTESGSAVGNVGQAVMGGMFGAESIGGGAPGGAGMGMPGGGGMAASGGARGLGGGMSGQASRALSSAGRLGVMNPVAGMAALGTGVATLGAKAAIAGGKKLHQRMQPNYHANQATRHMGMARQASDAGNVKGADKHMTKAGKHLEAQMDRMNKKSTFDTMVRWARHQETSRGTT